MKTIGYGLVQIPIITRYRVCCIKRTLAGGVTSTGWQEILGCTLRILLLSSWGLQSIDYSLPQTAEKIIGVYIEFTILSLQVANGIVILIGLWANNLYLLYPTLVVIPLCFLCDIIVKGSCYAALFLTPEVTSFGVLSLIEVWFRGLSLMYGWIVIISYIYYTKKDWKLTEVNIQLTPNSPDRGTIIRRTSSKSPFSRNSSLSQRGRRSFLMRKAPGKDTQIKQKNTAIVNRPSLKSGNQEIVPNEEDIALLQQTSRPTSRKAVGVENVADENSSLNNNTLRGSSKDEGSEILLGESAAMSLKRSPPGYYTERDRSRISSVNAGSTASKQFVSASLQRSPPRYKKRGGFVPEVLRTPSNLEKVDNSLYLNSNRKSPENSQSTAANTITYSGSVQSHNDKCLLVEQKEKQKPLGKKHQPRKEPPSLPSRPPAGISAPTSSNALTGIMRIGWFKKVKDKSVSDSPVALGKKHVPDPVLV